MSGPERLYWDSDVFLAWFQKEAGKFEKAQGTIQRAKDGEVVIFTSTLTIAEVLWKRNSPKITQDKAAIVRRFFRHSYIRLRNVTRPIAESAQELVWNHGIQPKDAIHVATALDIPVPILETFDDKLIKKSGKIGSSSLNIREPKPSTQIDFTTELGGA